VSELCGHCGIGRRGAGGSCDWCGWPAQVRAPLWTLFRRRLQRSSVAAALRRRGPLAVGVAAGIAVHLLVAALAVAADEPSLWQVGLFWKSQWWWALAPESVQPWVFSILRGAVYGLLAGWASKQWAVGGHPRSGSWQWAVEGGEKKEASLSGADARLQPVGAVISPAGFIALAAFVVVGWEADTRLEDRLVVAVVGAAVGGLTALLVRGAGARIR
jgi:hypothetical protein